MITKITYNWCEYDNPQAGRVDNWKVAEVGVIQYEENKEVKEITEHRAAGEGDKWYYDIVFIDDTEMRVFNPNLVYRNRRDKSSF